MAIVVSVVAAVALVIGGGGGFLAGRPDATTRAVDEIRKQEAVRDREQIKELTTVARASQAVLNQVLSDLGAAADNTRPASAQDVGRWRSSVNELVDKHADSPSGTTATNVARGGFRTAVNGFAIAIDLFAESLEVPAAKRPASIEIVKRTQQTATVGWSVAAAQLDQLNIDAGFGHQHVYLQSEQGGGDFTPDGEPEGVTN